MPVYGIEKKNITVSLPVAAYQSLCGLAEQRGQTPAQYIRSLTMQHLADQNLPLYCSTEIQPTAPADK